MRIAIVGTLTALALLATVLFWATGRYERATVASLATLALGGLLSNS